MLATEAAVLRDAMPTPRRAARTAKGEAVEQAIAARPSLGPDQKSMVRRLCREGDHVQVVVGKAGTGKTFALSAAREAWERSDIPVCGVAVARIAARTMEDEAAIPSTSVAALLTSDDPLRAGLVARGGVLVIDEAGTIGTRQLAAVMRLAQLCDNKLVLVGDPRQLPEIEAGGSFRALVDRLPAIALDTNRRQQRTADRELVEALREGRAEEALRQAQAGGGLVLRREIDGAARSLVAAYCTACREGDDALMLAPRRSEVRHLNELARHAFRSSGELGPDRLENDGTWYAVGDRVLVKVNDGTLGVENGRRGRIVGLNAAAPSITVDLGDERTVTLPPAFLKRRAIDGGPALVHGYAATAHASQGSTADRVFILGSEAIYAEWAYSAWTRGRFGATVFASTRDLLEDTDHDPLDADAAIAVLGALMRRSRAQATALEHGLMEARVRREPPKRDHGRSL
jgi:ATP-dependent exoDNAse (exonuclease V) alpha subunit